MKLKELFFAAPFDKIDHDAFKAATCECIPSASALLLSQGSHMGRPSYKGSETSLQIGIQIFVSLHRIMINHHVVFHAENEEGRVTACEQAGEQTEGNSKRENSKKMTIG